MSSLLLDGARIRTGVADDVSPVTQLIVAEETALRGSSKWNEAQTRDWFHALSGDQGATRIVERDGRVVGVLGLFVGPVTRGWISADPAEGYERIGPVLVDLAQQLAREREARTVKLNAFAENEALIRIFERAGFRPDKHYYTMQIDLNGQLPVPQWPQGIRCTTFEQGDARAFYDATIESFSEDADFTPLPFEEWKRRQFESADFDPTIWFIARDRNEIAGIARCWPERWGCGWVDILAVRKPWRRRGVGRALLQHVFRAFHERGRGCVGLEVDTRNPTGATRLYENAGMHVVAEDVAFAKNLQ